MDPRYATMQYESHQKTVSSNLSRQQNSLIKRKNLLEQGKRDIPVSGPSFIKRLRRKMLKYFKDTKKKSKHLPTVNIK